MSLIEPDRYLILWADATTDIKWVKHAAISLISANRYISRVPVFKSLKLAQGQWAEPESDLLRTKELPQWVYKMWSCAYTGQDHKNNILFTLVILMDIRNSWCNQTMRSLFFLIYLYCGYHSFISFHFTGQWCFCLFFVIILFICIHWSHLIWRLGCEKQKKQLKKTTLLNVTTKYYIY